MIITNKNDFNLPIKVYEYLEIDLSNYNNFEEIILNFISSKKITRTQIEYSNEIRHFKKYFGINNS
jgi:hypothetical protein